MAMNLGCNVRQTARRFLAGTGGDLRSSTGLAGAHQKARPCHTMPSSNNGPPFSVALSRKNFAVAAVGFVGLGFTLHTYSVNRRLAKLAKCPTCKANLELYERNGWRRAE